MSEPIVDVMLYGEKGREVVWVRDSRAWYPTNISTDVYLAMARRLRGAYKIQPAREGHANDQSGE